MTSSITFLSCKPICNIMSCLQRTFSLRMVNLYAILAVGTGIAMAQSEIEWVEGREYNFGRVLESDSVVSHRFVMRNAGDEPFSIVSATPRCRCTEAKFTPRVIDPGDTTSVLVKFYPHNREGNFIQRVSAVTTSRSRISYVFVKGFIVSEAKEDE